MAIDGFRTWDNLEVPSSADSDFAIPPTLVTLDSVNVLGSARSLKFDLQTGGSQATIGTPGGQHRVFSGAFRLDPSFAAFKATIGMIYNVHALQFVIDNSGATPLLSMRWHDFASDLRESTQYPISLGAFWRLELVIDSSAAGHKVTWGTALGRTTLVTVDTNFTGGNTYAAESYPYHRLGSTDGNVGGEFWVGQWAPVVFANAAADYPIGPVESESYSPDARGTHNLDAATSQYFFGNNGSADAAITTSESVSAGYIDEKPADTSTTDHVKIKTTTSNVAAPSYQAAGTLTGNISTNSVPWPTHQTDDIGLLIVESAGGEDPATPTGWTEVANSPQSSGTTTSGTRISVFWKRAASNAEANASIADAGDHTIAQILTFRGCVASGDPVDVTAGSASAVGTSRNFPSVTTSQKNDMVVLVITKDLDANPAFATFGSNATLGTITERVDAGDTTGNGGGIAAATAVMATAGATGTTPITVTSSVSAYMTIALKGILTQPTNTWYIEHSFGNTAKSVNPLAVKIYHALRNDSGTAANAITGKVSANGFTNSSDIYTGLSIASAVNIFQSLTMATAPGGATWTPTLLNAVTQRWGYTADADPAPRLENAVIEAIFPVSVSVLYAKTGNVQSAAAASGAHAGNAITKTGLAASEAKASAGDAATINKTGISISEAKASGGDAATINKTGISISAAVASGGDASTHPRTGAVSGEAKTSASDAATVGRSGIAISALVASGADVSTFSETAAIISEAKDSGVSAKTLGGKTGQVVSDLVARAADQSNFIETASVVSDAVTSGADQATVNRTGNVTSPAVASGADQSTHSETGAFVSSLSAAGPDQTIPARTGSVISALADSGADQATFTETGNVISALVGSGADQAIHAKTAIIISDLVVSGAKVRLSTGAQKSGAIISAISIPGFGIIVGGPFMLNYSVLNGEDVFMPSPSTPTAINKAGAVISAAVLSGADSASHAKSGLTQAQAILDSTASIVASETGLLVAALVLSGAMVNPKQKTGALISDVNASASDQYTASETGKLISEAKTSAGENKVANRLGSVISMLVISASDQFISTETATLISEAKTSGADQSQFTEAGSLASDIVSSGVDQSTFTETAIVISEAKLAGVGNKNLSGRAGSIISDLVTRGPSQQLANRTGNIISEAKTLGDALPEFNKTAKIISRAIASGADQFIATESGSVISIAFVSGSDMEVRSKLGSVSSEAQISAADVSQFSESGMISSEAKPSAGRIIEFGQNGAIVSEIVISGEGRASVSKVGTLLGAWIVTAQDEIIFTETGSIISRLVAKGEGQAIGSKSGSVISFLVLSGETPGRAIILPGAPAILISTSDQTEVIETDMEEPNGLSASSFYPS